MDNETLKEEMELEQEPDFVMDTASEVLDLIAQYNSSFTREVDRDEVCSILRILSGYLKFNAEKYREYAALCEEV